MYKSRVGKYNTSEIKVPIVTLQPSFEHTKG